MLHKRFNLSVTLSIVGIVLITAFFFGPNRQAVAEGAEERLTEATAVQLGTAFTYQGQLERDGSPYNGDCNFQFSLWDELTGGVQKGTTLAVNAVGVTDGLFAVELDFGSQFTGDARWLETAVQCAGDSGPTTLSPRTPLNPTPYALGLRPGARIEGEVPAGGAFEAGLRVTNSSADYPIGIFGIATATSGPAIGVAGNNASPDGFAVYGRTTDGGTAVRAEATGAGWGVYAVAENARAIVGESQTAHGVWGEARSDNMYGVVGKGMGSCLGIDCDVRIGFSHGVLGESLANGIGVVGISGGGDGVQGVSRTPDFAGVRGINRYGGTAVYGLSQEGGTAIYGRSEGGGYAAFFDGKAATKILEIQGGADLAERFEVSGGEAPEPGTLMIIDPDNPGHLRPSDQPYDARVAGVVSGAGDVQPGLTLHQEGVIEGDAIVAIAGRVYVRAEALSAPIQPGDLLTTSSIPGHAMKASDRERAYGTVIGKAMTGLSEGQGLVLVLVNLQ